MTPIIKVVITGPAVEGRFPYRIETEGTRLAHILNGISATPLLEACLTLRRMGAAPDAALIGMYYPNTNIWKMRTTVGYGAKWTAEQVVRKSPARPVEGAILSPGVAQDALKSPEGTEIAPEPEERTGEAPSAETTARLEEAPPPPSIPQEFPADTDQDQPEPAKPEHSHHKQKPKGSAARRGRR